MEVSCTRCGNRLPLSHGTPNEKGLLRLSCNNCGKRLLLKVSRTELKVSHPDLKLGRDEPVKLATDEADPAPVPQSVAPAQDPPVGPATSWTLHVTEFPPESLTTLRAALVQVPRYSRNPNKVFDMTTELPYEFPHLSSGQVGILETCLADAGALYRTTPQG